jgi:hypothetical protein
MTAAGCYRGIIDRRLCGIVNHHNVLAALGPDANS